MLYDALVGSAAIYYRKPARYFGDGRPCPFDENGGNNCEHQQDSERETNQNRTENHQGVTEEGRNEEDNSNGRTGEEILSVASGERQSDGTTSSAFESE